MKTIGFPISTKENENRRAILPNDLEFVRHPEMVFIEKGYGSVLGISDGEYEMTGVNVSDRETIMRRDIIVDPKIGDADYLANLNNQTVFGWVHAVQNKHITDALIAQKLTVFAWEDMFMDGRHVFYRNNEIAGEAAVIHAYMLFGAFPNETKVAVIGRGNIARGAIKILNYMGAHVTVYDRKTENLLRKELGNFDVIVNAIVWDTTRKDHIIFEADLFRMKANSLIIDVSCDRGGAVETSKPTSIQDPIYLVHGITHYVVDHTPALFFRSTTKELSSVVKHYIDAFICSEHPVELHNSKIIEKGQIIDQRIIDFQSSLK